jgi:hypothetical protein
LLAGGGSRAQIASSGAARCPSKKAFLILIKKIARTLFVIISPHCVRHRIRINVAASSTQPSTSGAAMGGTSVEYLRKRLLDRRQFELLAAIDRGEISTYAAAEAAGLIRRKPVLGTGSDNESKRRAWAIRQAYDSAMKRSGPRLRARGTPRARAG